MDETTQLPLRVLVVDDDAVCARTLAGMLRHVGPHSVDTAGSADEAVERLNVAAYDLILCDLNMPGRDGVETMRLLAERQITLHLSDQAVARVAEAGYDPVYGARPLKRALQKLVIDPLATRLLSGDFMPGDSIEADAEGDAVVFRKGVKGAAA